jgi:hypothetical protein
MQHLEGRGTPVLYIRPTVLKGLAAKLIFKICMERRVCLLQIIHSADTLRLTAFYTLSAVPSASPVSTEVYVSVGNKTFCIHHRSPATLLRISFCNPTIVTMFMLRPWVTCKPVSQDVWFFPPPQSKCNWEQHLQFNGADLIRTCLLAYSTLLLSS